MNIRKMIPLKLILLSFLALISLNVESQETYKKSPAEVLDIIDQVNKIYSANDELINGAVYPLPNPRIKGDPYLNDTWTPTTLYINNATYDNLFAKYDLTIDNIILKIETEDGIEKLVNLNKFQIDSLRLGNSLYINSLVIIKDNDSPTYYEEIQKGEYSLYIKYEKVFIKEYNNITPYGKYSSVRQDMYLFNNNELHTVNGKSAFLNYFNDAQQAEIKSFMKKNKIKYRKATKQELKELIKFCNTLSQK